MHRATSKTFSSLGEPMCSSSCLNKAFLSNFPLLFAESQPSVHEYKTTESPIHVRAEKAGDTPHSPCFFLYLFLLPEKALSKVLHDYVRRTWQASSGRHTGSNRFPFRNHKTLKVSVCRTGHAGKVWDHHPAARILLTQGVYFLSINSNMSFPTFKGQS